MCSSVWSRLSAVFVWFVCCLLAVINSVSTTLYYIHPRRINTPDGPTRVHYRMETLYGLFAESCWLFILSNVMVLWRKRFSQKCFSKSRVAMGNLKKYLIKGSWERTSGTTKWDRLGQVGVRGMGQVGQMGQGHGGLHIGWDRMGLGQAGLQIMWDRILGQRGLQTSGTGWD